MSRVAETSIKAYWEEKIGRRLGQQAAEVLDAVYVFGPCTRSELSRRTAIPINAICGRVRELLDAELLKESGSPTRDPVTGKLVKVLQVQEVQDAQV
jgi:chromosome segregation and condensation protein ScpB